jgi:hypothetical protein
MLNLKSICLFLWYLVSLDAKFTNFQDCAYGVDALGSTISQPQLLETPRTYSTLGRRLSMLHRIFVDRYGIFGNLMTLFRFEITTDLSKA